MKQGARKYFESLSYESINKMTFEEAKTKVEEFLPVGTKFKSVCMGNKDPWYVVKFLEDEEVEIKNHGIQVLVVCKSWNKYKQLWVYKVLCIHDFIFGLHLDLKFK